MDKYTPPKVWTDDSTNGGQFSSINRPTSGARSEKNLPVGEHSLQLYSLATPNGVKVTILLEELLALGVTAAEYDAFTINISDGDQFSSGFVNLNPNSKIPVLLDKSFDKPQRVFESCNILLYLAEKFGHFLPKDFANKTETLNWLFWQAGAAPYLGGGFGHFFNYAPEKYKYPIDRFSMEAKRQLHLLDSQLEKHPYVAGDEYTIADIAIWPWYGALVLGEIYGAQEFLNVAEYKNLVAWSEKISQRPAVKRGKAVNRVWGDESGQLHERHSSSDFEKLGL